MTISGTAEPIEVQARVPVRPVLGKIYSITRGRLKPKTNTIKVVASLRNSRRLEREAYMANAIRFRSCFSVF